MLGPVDLINFSLDNLSPLRGINILLCVEMVHAKLTESISLLGLVNIVVLIHQGVYLLELFIVCNLQEMITLLMSLKDAGQEIWRLLLLLEANWQESW